MLPYILSAGSDGGALREYPPSDGRYYQRGTRGSEIGRSAPGPCGYTDPQSVATCRRQGIRSCPPGTPSAAYSDAGRASISARQGVSCQQVARHRSKTQHQFLQVQSTRSVQPVVRHDLYPDCVGPPRRRRNPAWVTPRPSKVHNHVLQRLSSSNPLLQAAQEAHSRRFKPLALKKSVHPHGPSSIRSILKKRCIRTEDAVHGRPHTEVSHLTVTHSAARK